MLKRYVKKKWADFHLKHKCVKCPYSKRKTRDIHGSGECFWHNNWMNKNYEIPMWMGFTNVIRCKFNKPIKIRIEPLTLKQKILKSSLKISFLILIVWIFKRI